MYYIHQRSQEITQIALGERYNIILSDLKQGER